MSSGQPKSGFSYSTRSFSIAYAVSTLFYTISCVVFLTSSLLLKRYVQRESGDATVVATILALKPIDLNHGIALGVLIAFSVLFTVPGVITGTRGLLKTSACFNLLATLATLAVGLEMWFFSLIERQEYRALWPSQSPAKLMLIQDKFNCCGYDDSQTPKFVTSLACPNDDIALSRSGCVVPFTSFADAILHKLFTTTFAMTDVAVFALLYGLILIKRITELERFRYIDIKKQST
jgi:hypothetical protein